MEVPESLVDVAATGDRVAILRAMRDRIAAELDAGPPPHAVAPLMRELANVLTAIGAIAPPKEVSFLDRLAERNAGRGAAS